MTLHSYHGRPYRSERRRIGRRILGWCIVLIPWLLLAAVWATTADAQVSLW